MLDHSSSFFGDEMLVIQVEGCDKLVGFKTFVARSLKIVFQELGLAQIVELSTIFHKTFDLFLTNRHP